MDNGGPSGGDTHLGSGIHVMLVRKRHSAIRRVNGAFLRPVLVRAFLGEH